MKEGMIEKRFVRLVKSLALFCLIIGIMGGLLIGFFICDVRAVEVTEYDFVYAVSTTDTYEVGHAAAASENFTILRFADIDYFDRIDWLRIDLTYADASQNEQVYVTGKIGSDIIFTGDFVVSRTAPGTGGWTIWFFFDYFNRHSYVDVQEVTLYFDTLPNAANYFYNTGDYGDTYYTPLKTSGGNTVEGDYLVQYSGYWRNMAVVTDNLHTRINHTRVFAGVPYESDLLIWSDLYVYVDESDVIVNTSVIVTELPVYISCYDPYGTWHNVTHGEAPPVANQLYGYVFDTAGNFGLGNVNVSFQDQFYTSSDGGYYSFNSDTFGDSWLNLSKLGYHTSNTTLDYQGSTNLNLYMIANETVNPGTCTVSGIVYDINLYPIDDAYVKIFNDTFSTYIYTSPQGYFTFYDLTNTTYSLSVDHVNYVKQQKSINLTTLDTAYYYTFTLLTEGVDPEGTPYPTPTVAPTPTPVPGVVGGLDFFWSLLGLSAWKGLIYAMCVIGGLGMCLGIVSRGNPWLAAIGAFFGFILSVGFGWIPIWVVALALVGVAVILVKILGSDNR